MSDQPPPSPSPAASENAVSPGAPPPAPTPPPGAITAEPLPSVPPIPLTPEAKPTTRASTEVRPEHKDSTRELLETIVFVVVLVLMLKTFLAEAFVIPTGSMATTLLGYHYKVTCQQCGRPNLVNASNEAEPQDGRPVPVTGTNCQNCGAPNDPRR